MTEVATDDDQLAVERQQCEPAMQAIEAEDYDQAQAVFETPGG